MHKRCQKKKKKGCIECATALLYTAFICIELVNNREVILEMKQLSRSKMNTTPL